MAVPKQEESGATTSNLLVDGSGKLWVTTKFKAVASYTIASVELPLSMKGTGQAGTHLVKIYAHDAVNDEPGDILAGDAISDSINANTLGAEAWISFAGLACDVVLDSYYWIIMQSSANGDFTNCSQWALNDSGLTERIMRDADGVAPWTLHSAFNTGKFKIYESAGGLSIPYNPWLQLGPILAQ